MLLHWPLCAVAQHLCDRWFGLVRTRARSLSLVPGPWCVLTGRFVFFLSFVALARLITATLIGLLWASWFHN